MRMLTKSLVITSRWSTVKSRPSLIKQIYPKKFFIGVSFWGCAIVKRAWWDKWTDNGKVAVKERTITI